MHIRPIPIRMSVSGFTVLARNVFSPKLSYKQDNNLQYGCCSCSGYIHVVYYADDKL